MKRKYVKAHSEIVPLKTEAFICKSGNSGTAGDFEEGEGDPDPEAKEFNWMEFFDFSSDSIPPTKE